MDAHQIRQQNQQQQKYMGSNDGDTQIMMIFGYSARIFSEDEMPSADRVDLIHLEHDGTQDTAIRVDRYDIRHLLVSPIAKEDASGAMLLDSNELDSLRFATLRSMGSDGTVSEQDLFSMAPEERQAYIAYMNSPVKRDEGTVEQQEELAAQSSGIALLYDRDGNPIINNESADVDSYSANEPKKENADNSDDAPFVPKLVMPEGMVAPSTQRQFEIIERTAQFISEQQDPDKAVQLEILIQGKQGTNADFEFLSRASRLHSFYMHLRWLMQTGLYGYNESSSSDSDADADAGSEPEEASNAVGAVQPLNSNDAAEQSSLNTPLDILDVPDDIIIPEDPDIRLFIDKVASLVAKSPAPTKLEQKLRVEKATTSTKYMFLSPFDTINKYYCFRRDCYSNGLDETTFEKRISAARTLRDSSYYLTTEASSKAVALHKAQSSDDLTTTKEASSADQAGGDSRGMEESPQSTAVQAKRRQLALEFLKSKRQKPKE
ncbi:hypothetical protein GGI25_006098 [Coemansia spiralis]|uniref:SURP motif domain-containing protein n=2 Tax=Coemansia TaxID=4863 RepID=A0A9W8KVI1_9FUNG|nr:hypothetical protein BX070DRAFT_6073 [Coemansia spiralis]KAJ1990368.1 hypothetical protein EDC05_004132 [Coemansia umbellata]KAJ2620761.1 hypothetical protein GGI26_004749 [Coemansia sp. RSA 1358]KAJ2669604.1 hypothetical protein GGI25_006098 [Coemansia spiralis]